MGIIIRRVSDMDICVARAYGEYSEGVEGVNKERLDFLKKTINQDFTERHDIPQLHFNQSDLRWLIKQAERVEEMEMKYENTGSMFGRQNQRLLIEENKRLREALEFYADADYEVHVGYDDSIDLPSICFEKGKKARQALASEQS